MTGCAGLLSNKIEWVSGEERAGLLQERAKGSACDPLRRGFDSRPRRPRDAAVTSVLISLIG